MKVLTERLHHIPSLNEDDEDVQAALLKILVGAMVRQARERAGLTQAVVAKSAGVTQPWLAELESGRGNPQASTLMRLARAMGEEIAFVIPPKLTFQGVAEFINPAESVPLADPPVTKARNRQKAPAKLSTRRVSGAGVSARSKGAPVTRPRSRTAA